MTLPGIVMVSEIQVMLTVPSLVASALGLQLDEQDPIRPQNRVIW